MQANTTGMLHNLTRDHPLLQVALYHHRNLRGDPIGFRDRPSLVEFFTDFPHIDGADILKGVQTGASETFVQLAIERAGWSGRIVGYVLPTYGIRDRFVQTRINPLLLQVPAYRARMPGGDRAKLKKGAGNLKVKHLGNGTVLFLGANADADFIEFSADCLIVDEYDECVKAGLKGGREKVSNIAKAYDRIRESPTPQFFRLGNPEFPRRGVHALFLEGDQRRFHFRCEHCGERQPIDWFVNIVARDDSGNWTLRDRRAYVDFTRDILPCCRKCDRPFHRRAKGAAWIPENPGQGRKRSYRMTRLDILSQRIRELWHEWVQAQGDTNKVAAFWRGVLGMPYEPEGARFSDDLLLRLCEGQPPMDREGGEAYEEETTTAGIDVGSLFHVQVTKAVRTGDGTVERHVVYLGTCVHEDEVVDILGRYRVNTAVIDAGPETRISKKIRDNAWNHHGVSVYMSRFFKVERVGAEAFGMALDYHAGVVKTDRTQTFDAAYDQAKQGLRRWPVDASSVLGWLSQMKAPSRQFDDKKGRIVWLKGVDHFHLANVYDTIAWEIEQQGGAYLSL